MKSIRLSCTALVPAMIFFCVAAASCANAQEYLVGAYLFNANADGSTVGTNYQYDTDTDAAVALNVNGLGKGIAIPLSPGVNNFTFSQVLHTPSPNFATLGLFFSSTPTPYDPGAPARTPDLVASNATNGGNTFLVPLIGTLLNNYYYTGSDTSTANGVNVYYGDTDTLNISGYTVVPDPNGTFSITDTRTSTPEPGLFGLVSGLSAFGLLMKARRRRK